MEHTNPDPLAERARRAIANAGAAGAAASSLERAGARALADERAVADLLAAALNAPPAAECPVMVLLVDDQAIIAEALRRALVEQPDIDLHYCANAEDALRVVRETRPTVILQDLVMPGVDGLTLVRQYREHPATRDIPIIVLSTKEEPRIKSAAFSAGANDYLVKLPDTIELVARIRYHSRSYLNLLQRDEAYRALRQSQQHLLATNLELQRLTNSDGLTGLSNRRRLDDYVSAEWRRAMRDGATLGFLMIDVDNFKSYNDTYGHVAGDDVLKLIARTIESSLSRPGDLAARFGGEEFAVVLPGASAAVARRENSHRG
jgi:two-component system chemotaxis family response regulator WspR